MNKILLIIFTIVFYGCSNSNVNSMDVLSNKVKYNNSSHIVGEQLNSIWTLSYLKEGVQITFYIDKFPYKREFDLCADREYRCSSTIFINKDYQNYLFGKYKFKILDNIQTINNKGYPNFIESASQSEPYYFTGNIWNNSKID